MIKKNKYPIFSTKTCFSLFMISHPVPFPFLSYLLSPSFFFLLLSFFSHEHSETEWVRAGDWGRDLKDRERERVESRELRGRLGDWERESQRSGESVTPPFWDIRETWVWVLKSYKWKCAFTTYKFKLPIFIPFY